MEDNTRYLVRCEEASDWVRHVDEGTQIVMISICPGTF